MRHWTLRRRFALSVVVALVLLALLTNLVVWSFVLLGRTQTEVTSQLFGAVRNSTALLSAYLNQETGVRGFALTGEESTLQPYRVGRIDAANRGRDLETALRNRPDLYAQLIEVETVARAWDEQYAVRVIAAVQRAGPKAASTVSPDRGRALFDQVRDAHGRFEAAVLDARSRGADRLEGGRQALATAFVALAALVLLAGAGLGRAL